MRFEQSGPCTGMLDGNHGLGLVVCQRATHEAIAMARENGLGFIGVRESSHCGAIGLFGRMIAEAGLLGIVMTHSDAFVAPHRGFGEFLGTNPLCLSAPSAGGPPVCLDMATSATAWNVIMNARRENRAIKADIAFDADGNPTTDPHAVACVRPLAGHKGYALAFMIEIFCGPLNGAPWGPNIPPMYGDLAARRHLGSFVGAIDPTRFFGGGDIAGEVARFARSARMQPPVAADAPVLVPGDDHYARAKERLRTGIPVEPGLAAQIAEWSAKLDVAPPPAMLAAMP
jgi:ureidoglycolate dehydrogenase (NAD+)